ARTLEGARIEGVRRMGKHIVFDLDPHPAQVSVPKSGTRTWRTKKGRKARLRLARTGEAPVPTRAVGETPVPPRAGRAQWIVHLGMTGQMLVCSPDSDIEKHTHAIAKLKSGRELRF